MVGRRDALVAAAELISAVERIAHEHSPYGVGTVGALNVTPNSRNTIPGLVDLTVDIRNPDDAVLTEMGSAFRTACTAIADQRGLKIDIEEIWHNPPVVFDATCIDAVRKASHDLDIQAQDIVSGAGHDACMVARKLPTSMIFIPCADGISHNELESAEPEHIAMGCDVLMQAMLTLAQER